MTTGIQQTHGYLAAGDTNVCNQRAMVNVGGSEYHDPYKKELLGGSTACASEYLPYFQRRSKYLDNVTELTACGSSRSERP